MQSLITSYLIQNKKCFLPGIGVLKIIHTPASTDHAANLVLPPFETVVFSKEESNTNTGFTQYVSRRKQIPAAEAEDEITSFCNNWKERINAGESLVLDSIGSLKNNEGNIFFQREKRFDFFQPVEIGVPYQREEEVIREPEVTVARDSVLGKTEAGENYVVEKSYWGLWALILLAIGLMVLFYYYKDRAFTGASSGNQNKIQLDSAKGTYVKP